MKQTLEYPNEFGNYVVIKKIGKGTFSSVLLAEKKKTKEKFACKIIHRESVVKSGDFPRLEQELRAYEKINHPNIAKVVEIIYQGPWIIVVMEYCDGGSLLNYIVEMERLTEMEALKIGYQLIYALSYLHSRGIVHRDIKPENVVFDSEKNAKLIDFGLCSEKANQSLLNTQCGTIAYIAPEVFSGQPYDGKESDIWSLGITIYVMVNGALPWEQSSSVKVMRQIVNFDGSVLRNLPLGVRKLLEKMLVRDPSKRAKASDLMQDKQSEIAFPKESGSSFIINQNQQHPQKLGNLVYARTIAPFSTTVPARSRLKIRPRIISTFDDSYLK